MAEARAIIEQFDRISARHMTEISAYRDENPLSPEGTDLERWKQERLLKNLFEIAQPDRFDYEFHERRRKFLDQLEDGSDIDVGATFMDVCVLAGIRPLLGIIWNAHQARELVCDVDAPHAAPALDVFMFECLEFDVTLLRLYVDAAKFYGIDQFLQILTSRTAD